MYATRYLCFQGNIKTDVYFLLTAGDKWNIKVKYQLKCQRKDFVQNPNFHFTDKTGTNLIIK